MVGRVRVHADPARGAKPFASEPRFDYREPVHNVVIDLRELALWDSSAVAAIDKVVGKFRRNGMEVEVMAPLGAGRELHDKLALHDKGVKLDAGGH